MRPTCSARSNSLNRACVFTVETGAWPLALKRRGFLANPRLRFLNLPPATAVSQTQKKLSSPPYLKIIPRRLSTYSPTMADSSFQFITLGAILQSFRVKGINIVQGFPTQDLYVKHNDPYFGETIGRVANRIKDAKLTSLNGGQTYSLAANNGAHNLHGGVVGWGKREWNGPVHVGVRSIPGVEGLKGGESVEFTITSEDGDEGFPGEVKAKVIYTAGTQTVDGKEVTVLGIEYEAKLVSGAEETPINMTNHS